MFCTFDFNRKSLSINIYLASGIENYLVKLRTLLEISLGGSRIQGRMCGSATPAEAKSQVSSVVLCWLYKYKMYLDKHMKTHTRPPGTASALSADYAKSMYEKLVELCGRIVTPVNGKGDTELWHKSMMENVTAIIKKVAECRCYLRLLLPYISSLRLIL